MAKTKITYLGDSASVEWGGVTMEKGKAVDIDNAELVAKAANNRFFHVAGVKEQEERPKDEKPSIRDRGAAAKAAGKARTVPPAYRSGGKADEWLAGYDLTPEPEVEKPEADDGNKD